VLKKVLNLELQTHHSMRDPIEVVMISCYMTDSHSGEKEEYARLLNKSTAYTPRQSPKEVLSVEEPASKEQKKCPSKVELKHLPFHLRYEFFDSTHQFPVIVNAKLDGSQLGKLLDVLRKYRGAIGYSIDDITGLSPLLCMHRIFLNEGHRPS